MGARIARVGFENSTTKHTFPEDGRVSRKHQTAVNLRFDAQHDSAPATAPVSLPLGLLAWLSVHQANMLVLHSKDHYSLSWRPDGQDDGKRDVRKANRDSKLCAELDVAPRRRVTER